MKKDVVHSLSPVVSSSYALSEGLCHANSMLKLVALEGEDQYIVAFVGSNFSTGECTACGCIYDLYSHASSLAGESVAMSFITTRPTAALRKLWESSRLEASKEKALAHLSDNEYKFFMGHRLPWAANIPPPGYSPQQSQSQPQGPARATSSVYSAPIASSSTAMPSIHAKATAPVNNIAPASRPPGTTPYAAPTANTQKSKLKIVRRTAQ